MHSCWDVCCSVAVDTSLLQSKTISIFTCFLEVGSLYFWSVHWDVPAFPTPRPRMKPISWVCVLCFYLPVATATFSFNNSYSLTAINYDFQHSCAVLQCGGYGYCDPNTNYTSCNNCSSLSQCTHACITCPTPKSCYQQHSCVCPAPWDGSTTNQACSDTVCSTGSCHLPFCTGATCSINNGAECTSGTCACNSSTPLGSPCLGSCQIASSACPGGAISPCACAVGSCSLTTPGSLGTCVCGSPWSGSGVLGCDTAACPGQCGATSCTVGGDSHCVQCTINQGICGNCATCIATLEYWLVTNSGQPTFADAYANFVLNATTTPYHRAALFASGEWTALWPVTGGNVTYTSQSACQWLDFCPCTLSDYSPIPPLSPCTGCEECASPATCDSPTTGICQCPVDIPLNQDCAACPGSCASGLTCQSGTCQCAPTWGGSGALPPYQCDLTQCPGQCGTPACFPSPNEADCYACPSLATLPAPYTGDAVCTFCLDGSNFITTLTDDPSFLSQSTCSAAQSYAQTTYTASAIYIGMIQLACTTSAVFPWPMTTDDFAQTAFAGLQVLEICPCFESFGARGDPCSTSCTNCPVGSCTQISGAVTGMGSCP